MVDILVTDRNDQCCVSYSIFTFSRENEKPHTTNCVDRYNVGMNFHCGIVICGHTSNSKNSAKTEGGGRVRQDLFYGLPLHRPLDCCDKHVHFASNKHKAITKSFNRNLRRSNKHILFGFEQNPQAVGLGSIQSTCSPSLPLYLHITKRNGQPELNKWNPRLQISYNYSL